MGKKNYLQNCSWLYIIFKIYKSCICDLIKKSESDIVSGLLISRCIQMDHAQVSVPWSKWSQCKVNGLLTGVKISMIQYNQNVTFSLQWWRDLYWHMTYMFKFILYFNMSTIINCPFNFLSSICNHKVLWRFLMKTFALVLFHSLGDIHAIQTSYLELASMWPNL